MEASEAEWEKIQEERSKKTTAAAEGIHINSNHDQLTPQEQAKAGAKLYNAKDIQKLMRAVNMGKVGKSTSGGKEMRKAN